MTRLLCGKKLNEDSCVCVFELLELCESCESCVEFVRMFDLQNYVLPVDDEGNNITNPLLWRLPPPCMASEMNARQREAFVSLIEHIITKRLSMDSHRSYVIDSIDILRPLALCRVLTAHAYLCNFRVQHPLTVCNDGAEARKDFKAAVPFNVREVKVRTYQEQMPHGTLIIPVEYVVHCKHNKRLQGNTAVQNDDKFVRVREDLQ